MSLNQHPLDHHYQQFYLQMKAQYKAMYDQGGAPPPAAAAAPEPPPKAPEPEYAPEHVPYISPIDEAMDENPTKKGGLMKLFRPGSAKPKDGGVVEEGFELCVDLQRQQDGLGIGLTLDNIIVEVEPGGSVAAQGELQYGDQIVAVDGSALAGRMLKDVIVPRRVHKLVVRYTRISNQAVSPRRVRARKMPQQSGSAPRRIEELDVVISREAKTGRLGFGIDTMNTIVEVDPAGPVAGKLKVGDKIVAVDGALLNFKRFVDVVGTAPSHKLRVARLRASTATSGSSKSKKEKAFADSKAKNKTPSPTKPAQPQPASAPPPAKMRMPALREVRLVKEGDDTKIGAVFHRSDDAFDKSFFNVEGSSVQPIIKKVDPGSMAEVGGLVPGDVVLSVNGISGLSNFQVVEMLRKGQGVFNLVVISGRQVQQTLNSSSHR
jgi:C-terminal processing protease CtpA/Prc